MARSISFLVITNAQRRGRAANGGGDWAAAADGRTEGRSRSALVLFAAKKPLSLSFLASLPFHLPRPSFFLRSRLVPLIHHSSTRSTKLRERGSRNAQGERLHLRSISLLCDAARTQDGHVRRVHIDLVEHICRSSLLPLFLQTHPASDQILFQLPRPGGPRSREMPQYDRSWYGSPVQSNAVEFISPRRFQRPRASSSPPSLSLSPSLFPGRSGLVWSRDCLFAINEACKMGRGRSVGRLRGGREAENGDPVFPRSRTTARKGR